MEFERDLHFMDAPGQSEYGSRCVQLPGVIEIEREDGVAVLRKRIALAVRRCQWVFFIRFVRYHHRFGLEVCKIDRLIVAGETQFEDASVVLKDLDGAIADHSGLGLR